ncbi:MAG: hypothetical protein WAQ28_09640 [Bacteroidia bacterium]|jgi:hypothetical protein
MRARIYFIFLLCCTKLSIITYAQTHTDTIISPKKITKAPKELKFSFNEEGSHYVKFTFLNQIWARYNESNPGTTVFGTAKDKTYDIGLRRTRFQLFGQISDRVFFYTQFGINNFGYNSARKPGLFIHDGIAEYKVAKNYLSMGAGLTGWSGLSRYASPSAGTIMAIDAPLYQQSSNDVTDQFLRKLSIYAKGKLGRLDYRIIVSDPMSLQNSTAQSTAIGSNAAFSAEPGKAQLQGYFMYQFLDKEANLTPYTVGSYLGDKRVFNIGGGFISQQDAMWRLSDSGIDTLRSNLQLLAIDVFYDVPLNTEKGNALTAYASFSSNDYGKNYVRNLGVMNPATAVNAGGSFNGTGNAFPMYGTGTTAYAQIGYKFKNGLLGNRGTLQPYVCAQYSDYQLLKDPMLMYEAGINWLIESHRSKITLNYQDRPVFNRNAANNYVVSTRKGMVVIQFQIMI